MTKETRRKQGEMLRELRLPGVGNCHVEAAQQAEKEGWAFDRSCTTSWTWSWSSAARARSSRLEPLGKACSMAPIASSRHPSMVSARTPKRSAS